MKKSINEAKSIQPELDDSENHKELLQSYEKERINHRNWAVTYLILTLLVTLFGFCFHCWWIKEITFDEFVNATPLGHLNYYLLILPIIALDILLVSQFLKHTKLIDYYGHKKLIIIFISGKNSEFEEPANAKFKFALYDRLLEPPIVNDKQAIKVKLDKLMLAIGSIKEKDE